MKKVLFSVVLSTLVASPLALAGDAAAGQAKAAMCAACHGAAGISPTDLWPNLAGQKEGYIAKQLKAFRDGDRHDPTMTPMAKPLTDEDIANLAAYFASLGK